MLKKPVLALAAILVLAVTAARGDTLDQVKKRGYLACGSNSGRAGFGLPDGHGHWAGLNIDFCRALAAAIFDDAGKVKFVPLTAKDRFAALQSGAVDVLASNTTRTLSRETKQGLLFAGINYFDGQRFMAHRNLNRASVHELSGTSICVQQYTTTELNLADFFHANSMTYKPVAFATADEAIEAYVSGRCDVYTADASDLYARRMALADPDDNIVLPEIISKEPLGPFALDLTPGNLGERANAAEPDSSIHRGGLSFTCSAAEFERSLIRERTQALSDAGHGSEEILFLDPDGLSAYLIVDQNVQLREFFLQRLA